ncbi:hypothetical protein DMH01_14780 [Amycolatopsis sp. WAC 04182]|nr:hypothetical protein DMH01_14780 [Amycolatopsis sp. WAC 04182]
MRILQPAGRRDTDRSGLSTRSGWSPAVRPRLHGGRPPAFNAELNKHRNVVERCFNGAKQFRDLAIGYAKRAAQTRLNSPSPRSRSGRDDLEEAPSPILRKRRLRAEHTIQGLSVPRTDCTRSGRERTACRQISGRALMSNCCLCHSRGNLDPSTRNGRRDFGRRLPEGASRTSSWDQLAL